MKRAATTAAGSGVKCFRSGTHRISSPDLTLSRIHPLLPVLGITRIANITGLDRIGIPVVMACRPNARSLSVSQGKGLDLACAKASAIMESIEDYHAERITIPLRLASYEELRYTRTLADPDLLPKLQSGGWHDYLPVLWTEGYDLLSDAAVLVPYELIHMNAALDALPGRGSFYAESSGLAAGNHVLEAISHGICELVERDAVVLWRLREERAATRLDLSSVDDEGCRWLIEKFIDAKIDLGVWEVTSDVVIPTFLCCALERAEDRFHPMPLALGSGTHPSRAIALSRALTEAAQSRATLIAGTRDDLSGKDYEHLFSPDAAQPWRRLMHVPPTRKFHEAPDFSSENLRDDVEWELQQLNRAGLSQVIVADLTKPEFQIPVVRVVIPGLEPDDPDRKLGPRSLAILEQRVSR